MAMPPPCAPSVGEACRPCRPCRRCRDHRAHRAPRRRRRCQAKQAPSREALNGLGWNTVDPKLEWSVFGISPMNQLGLIYMASIESFAQLGIAGGAFLSSCQCGQQRVTQRYETRSTFFLLARAARGLRARRMPLFDLMPS